MPIKTPKILIPSKFSQITVLTFLGLIVIGILSYHALNNFLEFKEKEKNYKTIITKAEKLKDLCDKKDTQYISNELNNNIQSIKNLLDYFKKYEIKLSEKESLIKPEEFQDQLYHDIITLQNEAQKHNVILPVSFFLGLQKYKEHPPESNYLQELLYQKPLLVWIANKICQYQNLIVKDFLFKQENRVTNFPKIQLLGDLTIKIITHEDLFRHFINELTNAPYYFIIKEIKVENSTPNPPLHKKDQNENVILGNEEIIANINISFINFLKK